jgi:hypothetical protein
MVMAKDGAVKARSAAVAQAAPDGRDQVALEVVAVADQVVIGVRNFEFAAFEVGEAGIEGEILVAGAFAQ